MQWTKEKPTREGYYWGRLAKGHEYYSARNPLPPFIEIVVLHEGKLCTEVEGREGTEYEPFREHIEWAGPLEPPKEESDEERRVRKQYQEDTIAQILDDREAKAKGTYLEDEPIPNQQTN